MSLFSFNFNDILFMKMSNALCANTHYIVSKRSEETFKNKLWAANIAQVTLDR